MLSYIIVVYPVEYNETIEDHNYNHGFQMSLKSQLSTKYTLYTRRYLSDAKQSKISNLRFNNRDVILDRVVAQVTWLYLTPNGPRIADDIYIHPSQP